MPASAGRAGSGSGNREAGDGSRSDPRQERQHARERRPLCHRAGGECAAGAATRLGKPREERRPLLVAAGIELDERGRRGSTDRADSEPLRSAGGEQPRGSAREREEDEPRDRNR